MQLGCGQELRFLLQGSVQMTLFCIYYTDIFGSFIRREGGKPYLCLRLEYRYVMYPALFKDSFS